MRVLSFFPLVFLLYQSCSVVMRSQMKKKELMTSLAFDISSLHKQSMLRHCISQPKRSGLCIKPWRERDTALKCDFRLHAISACTVNLIIVIRFFSLFSVVWMYSKQTTLLHDRRWLIVILVFQINMNSGSILISMCIRTLYTINCVMFLCRNTKKVNVSVF